MPDKSTIAGFYCLPNTENSRLRAIQKIIAEGMRRYGEQELAQLGHPECEYHPGVQLELIGLVPECPHCFEMEFNK